MRRVGWIAAERLGSDVDVNLTEGSAYSFGRSAPARDSELTITQRLPFDFPLSDALLSMEIAAGAYQFVAYCRLQV